MISWAYADVQSSYVLYIGALYIFVSDVRLRVQYVLRCNNISLILIFIFYFFIFFFVSFSSVRRISSLSRTRQLYLTRYFASYLLDVLSNVHERFSGNYRQSTFSILFSFPFHFILRSIPYSFPLFIPPLARRWNDECFLFFKITRTNVKGPMLQFGCERLFVYAHTHTHTHVENTQVENVHTNKAKTPCLSSLKRKCMYIKDNQCFLWNRYLDYYTRTLTLNIFLLGIHTRRDTEHFIHAHLDIKDFTCILSSIRIAGIFILAYA